MGMLKLYVINRLKEASTWRGIFMLLTALGLNIAPELQDSILLAGVALVGVAGVVTKG